MKKTVRLRAALSAFAVAGLVLTATGCSAVEEAAQDQVNKEVEKITEQEYQVTYEVTGEGIDSIDYGPGGDAKIGELETVEKPQAPWKKTVTLKGITPPSLTVTLGADGGKATCAVTHEGKVIEEQTVGKPFSIASCIAVSPIAK